MCKSNDQCFYNNDIFGFDHMIVGFNKIVLQIFFVFFGLIPYTSFVENVYLTSKYDI
jgi:hypothetical protein